MPSAIQALSPNLIQTMAAGEVMDSWEAVVRELVENALDAQAQRIQIQVDFSARQLQVSDNGVGMTRTDLDLCCLAHRTSKIAPTITFPSPPSLGFRGEALHSLTQVGQVQIASRSQNLAPGWLVAYDSEGNPQTALPKAMAPGTTVGVKDLFQAWPHRQQPPSWKHIQRLIQHIALCHPQVTWQLSHGGRNGLHISSGQSAKDIVLQVLPQVHPGDLASIRTEHFELVVGLPDRQHRRKPDWLLLAVNGRCVTLKGERGQQLQHSLLQTWQQTLPRHRYPLCFVHLHIPNSELDWHCHPGKQEVYLADPQAWQTRLETALTELIGQKPAIPIPRFEPQSLSPNLQTHPGTLPTASVAETSGDYGRGVALLQAQTQLNQGPGFKVLGQIHQTYILVEQPTGLWLVEQHIAHERVLYEQLLGAWQVVDLVQPVTLERLSPQQVIRLEHLNLSPEPFGPDLWLVRQAPALVSQHPDLVKILLELSQSEDLAAALVTTACRSAIRNGTPLTLSEMHTLIAQWQRTEHPRTCPHGRPICLSLQESSLARYFRRHWLIGTERMC